MSIVYRLERIGKEYLNFQHLNVSIKNAAEVKAQYSIIFI